MQPDRVCFGGGGDICPPLALGGGGDICPPLALGEVGGHLSSLGFGGGGGTFAPPWLWGRWGDICPPLALACPTLGYAENSISLSIIKTLMTQ